MSLLEKLSINKKITAIFADGTRQMNLGISSVTALLNGTARVPVQIAPLKRAQRLLTNLAESAGRTVHKAEDGVFLVQPGVEVGTDKQLLIVQEAEAAPEAVFSDPEPVPVKVEPVIVQPVEVEGPVIAQKVEPVEVAPVKVTKVSKVDRKYATLTKIFFNGSPMGQVLSIYKTRETNPTKWADYRAAIANGDCVLPSGPFSKSVAEKMKALGFNVLE